MPIRKSDEREPEKTAARRAFGNPEFQRRQRRTKDADFREGSLLPSQVFARRLREAREARGLTQTELARRMRATGDPISQPRLSEIENGKRSVKLDEALALTEVLRAVPAHMLTPPEGKLIRLSAGLATDGSEARSWLVSGLPQRTDERLKPPDVVAHDQYARRLHHLALALVDAYRIEGDDGQDARAFATRALAEAVLREEGRIGQPS